MDKAQAEITSGVFTEEGDAFETLENTATVVKDGCKVVGFVGGVVVTGGVAGLAAAGTVAQALADLLVQHPALRSHLFNVENRLRPHINLFVEGTNVRDLQGLDTPLAPTGVLRLVPSIAGG
mgnify:CR=1 FL=1